VTIGGYAMDRTTVEGRFSGFLATIHVASLTETYVALLDICLSFAVHIDRLSRGTEFQSSEHYYLRSPPPYIIILAYYNYPRQTDLTIPQPSRSIFPFPAFKPTRLCPNHGNKEKYHHARHSNAEREDESQNL